MVQDVMTASFQLTARDSGFEDKVAKESKVCVNVHVPLG